MLPGTYRPLPLRIELSQKLMAKALEVGTRKPEAAVGHRHTVSGGHTPEETKAVVSGSDGHGLDMWGAVFAYDEGPCRVHRVLEVWHKITAIFLLPWPYWACGLVALAMAARALATHTESA